MLHDLLTVKINSKLGNKFYYLNINIQILIFKLKNFLIFSESHKFIKCNLFKSIWQWWRKITTLSDFNKPQFFKSSDDIIFNSQMSSNKSLANSTDNGLTVYSTDCKNLP